jgi:hypothetical protein
MFRFVLLAAVVALSAIFAMGAIRAAEPGEMLVFAAAPRESEAAATAIYAPIADYLSAVLGRPVAYRYVGDWGVYRTHMLRGEYDLVFDGPHFNGYRLEKLQHQVLVRLPGGFQFAIIARDDLVFKGMRQLYRNSFCAFAPPNLGTLVLLDLFDNPMRQPLILAAASSEQIYQGVVARRCTAGMLPLAHFRQLDRDGRVRILYTSDALPNQALSAGPRVTAAERARLVSALTSPTALAPTAALRTAWKVDGGLMRADAEDYAPPARYLRNEWGFY